MGDLNVSPSAVAEFLLPGAATMIRLTEPSPVVLLTGAGASCPLGMPTMREFRENFGANLSGEEQGIWRAVIDASGSYNRVASDDVDIEQALTCIEDCEMSFRAAERLWKLIWELTKGSPTVDEIHLFRQNLWSLRISVLNMICQKYGEAPGDDIVALYDPLFKLIRELSGQGRTEVFTTNYDLSLEVFVRQRPADYELADGFQTQTDGTETWVGSYVPPCDAPHSLVLYKLHGSTSWVGNPPSGAISKREPSTFGQGVDRTVLIYPTKRKRRSQRLFVAPFNHAYGRLNSLFMAIGAIRVFLVIGYRFGDSEVRQTISDGLEAEDGATMVVVDPNATLDAVSAEFPTIPRHRLRVIQQRFGKEATLEEIRCVLSGVLASP